jgi:signal recognition particle GTPase
MIAACDTFRSGAVEQLKTHCGRLGVPLYERGGWTLPTPVHCDTDMLLLHQPHAAEDALRAAGRAAVRALRVDSSAIVLCG